MKESVKHLARLARQMEDLGIGLKNGGWGAMSESEMKQLLLGIRNVFDLMEQGLNTVAGVLEGRAGKFH